MAGNRSWLPHDPLCFPAGAYLTKGVLDNNAIVQDKALEALNAYLSTANENVAGR